MFDIVTLKVENIVSIELSVITSNIVRNRYQEYIVDSILDFLKVSQDARVELLEDICNMELNEASVAFDDEMLRKISNGREIHNDFFNKVNMRLGIMKKGNLSDSDKMQKFIKTIIETKKYLAIMKELSENINFAP